jgi:hypothetical protein
LSAQERQPFDKEAALGAKLAQDFKQEATILESAAFNKYIERIGSELSAQLGTNQPKYSFGLIAAEGFLRNPLHEAVSFPGGYIFVPANLITSATDEEEFVRIIAHAIAHIAGQLQWHAPNRGPVPVIYLGGRFGLGGGDDLAPLGLAKAMHDSEAAADKLAAEMVARMSPDTVGSPDEFLRVQTEIRNIVAERGPRPPSLRSAH